MYTFVDNNPGINHYFEITSFIYVYPGSGLKRLIINTYLVEEPRKLFKGFRRLWYNVCANECVRRAAGGSLLQVDRVLHQV